MTIPLPRSLRPQRAQKAFTKSDSKAAKKKRRRKKKKGPGAAAAAATGAPGAPSGPAQVKPSAPSRPLDAKSKTVADQFKDKPFPTGEIMNYKDDNLWRTTR